ncbi:MAG TPA: CHAT domain-containing protein [Longimicrobium sp.]|nr:CHAT domain-containing protein [Longimicrobium sp.]
MSKVKVLFFAADPLSVDGSRIRLQLDSEARKIKHELLMAGHRDSVDFETCWATQITDLRQALNRVKPDVVHFSGHGGAEGLVLVGADGRGPHHVGAAALKQFFQAYRGQIRVVVLNACHSHAQAEAIAEAVGCAIGTPSSISDNAAVAFSAAFYSSIAFGNSVLVAFDQARATLNMEDFAEDEWPVLVARKDVDPSKLVLISPDDSALPLTLVPPSPPPSRRLAKRTAVVTGIALSCGAAYLGFRPDPACATARAVQRDAIAASFSAQGQVSPVSAPIRGPNDPLVGPKELAQARRLHKAGDHAADFILFQQAAEDGNVEAMTHLGLAYLHGEGIPVDDSSGVQWLRKAANEGDPRAMTELGNAYLKRQGVGRNSDYLAKDWFEKAAAKDYPEAMRNLGNLYREGRGVQADGVAALDWYAKAARAGLVDAMVDAGWMYEQGMSVRADGRQAMCWYQAAADAGSIRGKAAVGIVDEKNLSKADDRD